MTHTDCDDALTSLYQYLDKELDTVSSTEIRSHLDECSGCFQRFDFERRLKSVVKERLSEEVSDEFIQRLNLAVAEEIDKGS